MSRIKHTTHYRHAALARWLRLQERQAYFARQLSLTDTMRKQRQFYEPQAAVILRHVIHARCSWY